MAADHRYELNDPSVVAETVDGEVMAMNLREGVYYSIAGTGAAVWPALMNGASLEAIATSLARAGGIEEGRAAQDLDVFVARLVDEAILRPRRSSSAACRHDALTTADAEATLPNGLVYSGLAVERFDDMRAMLVLDPVHEVGEFGWPQAGDDRNL